MISTTSIGCSASAINLFTHFKGAKTFLNTTLFLAVLFSWCFTTTAQQTPHFSHWATHQFAINPAHAGIKTCLEAQGTTRGQWIKFDGAPISGVLTISAPLRAKRKQFLSARHGLGSVFNYDQLGAFRQFTFQLAYAGHFNFSVNNRLSLGLSVGGTQLAFDINQAKPLTADPTINGSGVEVKPTATFGAWWNGKNYFAGLSLYQLIPQKWRIIGFEAKSNMHGMFNGGFRQAINQKWTLVPGAYIGFTKSAPLDIQIQTLFDYSNQFVTGLGYRSGDALIAFFGCRIRDRVRLMYSFDFIISPLRKGTLGSHELSLSFSPCRMPSSDQQLCPLFQ